MSLSVSTKIKVKMIAYLKNCYAFSDDVSANLFEKFEINLKQCHLNIQRAIEGEDRGALKTELHALKGVLLNGGLMEEGDLANCLELKVVEETVWEELNAEARSLFHRLMEAVDVADRKKALVVDDMVFVREFVKKSLAKLFPTMVIEEAEEGQSALKLLESGDFDLVICDWELPGITGLEILKQVRSHPKMKSTPFMMLTANGDREHVVQAMQLGASDYLVKPVKLDTLAAKVRKLVFPGG